MAPPATSVDGEDVAAEVVRALTAARRTIAVAESLTGGAVTAALVAVPGASAVLRGGVVAYATPLKASLLGVDAELLAAHGAVHPLVAEQMARGVREAAAIGGVPADYGLATTGVAGPDPQDGAPVGLVYVAVADAEGCDVREVRASGVRSAIRATTTRAALELMAERLACGQVRSSSGP